LRPPVFLLGWCHEDLSQKATRADDRLNIIMEDRGQFNLSERPYLDRLFPAGSFTVGGGGPIEIHGEILEVETLRLWPAVPNAWSIHYATLSFRQSAACL
jgi:hypothetical protein